MFSTRSSAPACRLASRTRWVRVRQIQNPIEVDRARVPVTGEALQQNVILRHPLDEAERAGAYRVQREFVARPSQRPRRQHHPRPIRELSDQRGVGCLEVELHCQRIDDVDGVDRVDFAPPHRAFGGQIAHQRDLHRLGVHRLVILEFHSRAEMNHQMRRIPIFVAGGELRYDLQLRVDVEQLVAERGEDEPADIAGAERRIEQVGVLAKSDAQRPFLRDPGGDGRQRERAGQEGDEARHPTTLRQRQPWCCLRN